MFTLELGVPHSRLNRVFVLDFGGDQIPLCDDAVESSRQESSLFSVEVQRVTSNVFFIGFLLGRFKPM